MALNVKGGALKAWHFIRWPLAIVVLGGAVVLVLIGGIQSVGYFGTTSLRGVKTSSPEWTSFQADFGGTWGKPYSWKASPTIENGLVRFDSRLIRVFEYIKQKNPTVCGWDGQHETISLDAQADPKTTLATPSYNLDSTSTVYRGVGVRITGADKVKCSYRFINKCTTDGLWYKYDDVPISFIQDEIPKLKINPYDPICREVKCAVDYYPNSPVDVTDPRDITPTHDNSLISSLNPGIFDGLEFPVKIRKAVDYKASQIAFEAMSVDRPGCETNDGNKGYESVVPYQVIFPHWIQKELGNTWKKIQDYHEDNFGLRAQKSSPLTGTALDDALNNKGLHINY